MCVSAGIFIGTRKLVRCHVGVVKGEKTEHSDMKVGRKIIEPKVIKKGGVGRQGRGVNTGRGN